MIPFPPLIHWAQATDTRYPWSSREVISQIREWLTEHEHADILAAAGEKVTPLLLEGETRCGKTSTVCEVARRWDLPVFRMSIASVLSSYLGESTKLMIKALEEAASSPQAIWILDEVDGIFSQRSCGISGASDKERNSAMAAALTAIENLPKHVSLVATTNEIGLVDRAMVARFTCVRFPKWEDLAPDERRSFAKSHGHESLCNADSYAQVVQKARTMRVRKIIEQHEASKRNE